MAWGSTCDVHGHRHHTTTCVLHPSYVDRCDSKRAVRIATMQHSSPAQNSEPTAVIGSLTASATLPSVPAKFAVSLHETQCQCSPCFLLHFNMLSNHSTSPSLHQETAWHLMASNHNADGTENDWIYQISNKFRLHVTGTTRYGETTSSHRLSLQVVNSQNNEWSWQFGSSCFLCKLVLKIKWQISDRSSYTLHGLKH